MDQSGISQFIIDRSDDSQNAVASTSAPQQFSPPTTVYVAQVRTALFSRSSSVLAAILIVLLIVVIFYFARRRTLARNLAACGWILYTRPGCGFCTKQIMTLGVKTYPKQIVCIGSTSLGGMSDSQGPYMCENVNAFPFWVNEFTNATRTGFQNREQLYQMLWNPSSS